MGMGDALHRGLRKGCPWGERDMARLFRHRLHPFFLEIGLMKFVGVGGSWLSLGSAIRCQSDPPPPKWSGSHLKSLGNTERWLGLKSPLPRLPWPHSLSPGKMSLGRSPREGRTLKSQRWFWRPSLNRKGEAPQLQCVGEWVRRLPGGNTFLFLFLFPRSPALPWSSAGRGPFGSGAEGSWILPGGAQGSGHFQASAEAVPAACQVREGINLLFKAND